MGNGSGPVGHFVSAMPQAGGKPVIVRPPSKPRYPRAGPIVTSMVENEYKDDILKYGERWEDHCSTVAAGRWVANEKMTALYKRLLLAHG